MAKLRGLIKLWGFWVGCLRLSIAAIVLTAGVAGAKPGTPGPEYFAGSYDRIGRDADFGFLNDLVQIDPAGAGLKVTACSGPPLDLNFGPAFEIVNLMTGSQDGDAVDCLFHNNGYNYPILTCRSEAGAAFTLWPTTTRTMNCNG